MASSLPSWSWPRCSPSARKDFSGGGHERRPVAPSNECARGWACWPIRRYRFSSHGAARRRSTASGGSGCALVAADQGATRRSAHRSARLSLDGIAILHLPDRRPVAGAGPRCAVADLPRWLWRDWVACPDDRGPPHPLYGPPLPPRPPLHHPPPHPVTSLLLSPLT